MAPFLSRLISIQKIFSSNIRAVDKSSESKRVKPPEFDSSKQVRILLFRELNGQDRKLLFDSKSVRKRDPAASPTVKEKPPLHLRHKRFEESSIEKSFKLNDNQSKEFVYEWQKSSPDEQMLREMIFGSVSISYQGPTLKVHTIRSPLQIMLSVVFAPPPIPMFRIGEHEAEESGNWTAPANEININNPLEKSDSHLDNKKQVHEWKKKKEELSKILRSQKAARAHSVPVNVPSRLSGHYGEYQDSDSDSLQSHDGYSSLPTTQHLTPESAAACLPRSSSYNSLQRRLLRNKATSIEMGLQKPDATSNSEDYSRGSGQKRVKLGLSIVINLNEDDKNEEKQFSHFLFTHMPLIEGHLMNLRDTVVRAYLNRRNFVQLMFEGAKKFQQAIQDLYTAPRLQNPEWLTIISSPNHRHLSYSFLAKFAFLLRQYDKKETHFFVSTLLTAVLTHHLSWVPSVIPSDSKIHSTQTNHKHTPCWVDLLAKSRPYNPHWVQLSDLYGALGSTLKLSKTIVKGDKKDVILQFLQVLSYFIRCSDICEQSYEKMDSSVLEAPPNNERFQSSKTETSSSRVNSTAKVLSTQCSSSNSSTIETCNVPCCSSEQSLPKSLCTSRQTIPDVIDTDSNSDSSKDTCDVSITPTEEHISAVQSIFAPLSESIPVPILTCNTVETTGAEEVCGSSSLGFVSLQENLDSPKLSERLSSNEQTDSCLRLSNVAQSSSTLLTDGKETSPLISVTLFADASETQTTVRPTGPEKCCSCDNCPCYDKLPSCNFTKGSDFGHSTEVKECESIEEGYHSMEEPHSPSRGKTHLSELLKQYENWCPEGLEEVPLTKLQHSKEETSSLPYKSFGWSLMAGVTDYYLTDFCLQGLNGPLCEETIKEDLIRSTNTQVLGEQVSEAVCIVADTDKWNVQLLSSNFVGGESLGMRVLMSSLVSEMCDAVLNMCDLGIPAESCIIYLEDRLQELYFRSQLLSDFLRSNRSAIPFSKVSNILNVDVSDMPLLLSVATTHSPYLSA